MNAAWQPGQILGRYVVERALPGSDPAVSVFLARDPHLDRPVQIVRFGPEVPFDLVRERAVALMREPHPHVALVQAIGPDYVVVDSAWGSPPRVGGSWTSLVTALIPVIQALSHLHQAGIVHGRLGRDSLREGPDGTLMLVDVASAWIAHGATDPAEDVEALVRLCVALTGRAEGTGDRQALLAAVRRLPRGLAESLSAVLTGRVTSAHDFAEDLEAALPRPRQRPLAHRIVWAVGAVALGVIALSASLMSRADALSSAAPEPAVGSLPFAATSTPEPVPSPDVPTYAVQGRVYWGREPLAGVFVHLGERANGSVSLLRAQTAADGQFRFESIRLPRAWVGIEAEGYALAPYVPPAPQWTTPADLSGSESAPGGPSHPLRLPWVEAPQTLEAVLQTDLLVVRTDLGIEEVFRSETGGLVIRWLPYVGGPAVLVYLASVRTATVELTHLPIEMLGPGLGVVDLAEPTSPMDELGRSYPVRLWGTAPVVRPGETLTVTLQAYQTIAVDAGPILLPIAQGSWTWPVP